MEPIKIKNLNVAYDKHQVINDVSLTIPNGKISILIGANGCGKSTLLKSIVRVIKAQSGEILVHDKNIDSYKPKELAKQVAFLPQSPIAPEGLCVYDLVSYGRFPHQKSLGGLSYKDKEVIEWALKETNMWDIRKIMVNTLSQGQRQRAWIAMTLAQESDIIILDEPTTYLDMGYQLEVLNVLKSLNERSNITIVMVLHEINNATRFADNIIGLKVGDVVFEGHPLDVITSNNLKKIYDIEAKLQLSEDKTYPLVIDYEAIDRV